MRTSRRSQKVQLGPAITAKPMILLDDCSASGATRRQHEIKDRTE
jgi:hypothetical protein